MGHIVTKDGISVDPAKIEAIVNWPRSTKVSKVRSFLGITGCYRRFVEGFSKLAFPITKLLRKTTKFEWTPECEDSFQELKKRLVSAPILAIPEGNEQFVIYSDASKKGLGCVLMQKGRVIAYASRRLCLSSVEALRRELSNTQLRIGRGCICLENLETLPLWSKV